MYRPYFFIMKRCNKTISCCDTQFKTCVMSEYVNQTFKLIEGKNGGKQEEIKTITLKQHTKCMCEKPKQLTEPITSTSTSLPEISTSTLAPARLFKNRNGRKCKPKPYISYLGNTQVQLS